MPDLLMRRTQPLRQRPSCDHAGCANSTICRHTNKPLRSKAPPRTRTALPRGGRIKPNRKRREREFERAYGGSAYVQHLHQFPCSICGVAGWTVAAHTRSGGKGRNADADTLAPLCASRMGVVGCHDLLDTAPWLLPEGTQMRLRALAKRLWRDWNERRESESGT